jgi:hypothetical protein
MDSQLAETIINSLVYHTRMDFSGKTSLRTLSGASLGAFRSHFTPSPRTRSRFPRSSFPKLELVCLERRLGGV